MTAFGAALAYVVSGALLGGYAVALLALLIYWIKKD